MPPEVSEFPELDAIDREASQSEFPELDAIDREASQSEFPELDAIDREMKASEFPELDAIDALNAGSEPVRSAPAEAGMAALRGMAKGLADVLYKGPAVLNRALRQVDPKMQTIAPLLEKLGYEGLVRSIEDKAVEIADQYKAAVDQTYTKDAARAGGASGILLQDVPEGIGSFIPVAIASILTGGGATPVMLSGMFQGAAQGAEDADQHGATDLQRNVAVLGNAALGLTEKFGLGQVPGQMVKGVAERASKRVLGRALVNMGEEALQNPLQQLGQNVIAKDVANFDPERPRMEGVGRAAVVGALAGGAGSLGGDVVVGAANAGRPVLADIDGAEANWVESLGRERVRRLNPNTLQVSTPDNRSVVLVFRGAGERLAGQESDTAFIESVAAGNQAEVDQVRAAVQQQNPDAAPDVVDRGVAIELDRRGYMPVGLTSKAVTLPEIRDPANGAELKADVLVEIVSGEATVGTLAHEDLHALLRLAGVTPTETEALGGEEKLAQALDKGTAHPVLQKVRDFIYTTSRAIRGDKSKSLYQTARELRDQTLARVRDAKAPPPVPQPVRKPFKLAVDPRAEAPAGPDQGVNVPRRQRVLAEDLLMKPGVEIPTSPAEMTVNPVPVVRRRLLAEEMEQGRQQVAKFEARAAREGVQKQRRPVTIEEAQARVARLDPRLVQQEVQDVVQAAATPVASVPMLGALDQRNLQALDAIGQRIATEPAAAEPVEAGAYSVDTQKARNIAAAGLSESQSTAFQSTPDLSGEGEKLSGDGVNVNKRDASKSVITPEQDAEYMAAVNSGNMAEAQRLVDEAIANQFFTLLSDETLFTSDDHIAIRSDDAVVSKRFRRSWNRPDGRRTTRLPGISTVYVGYDRITPDKMLASVQKSRDYMGKFVYLLAGDSPTHLQHLANDPGEKILTDHRIIDRASADPVTRDDRGNVIPLSKRFNDQSQDISYSVAKKQHRTVARVAATDWAAPIAGRLQEDARSFYDPQEMRDVTERVRELSPAQRDSYLSELDAIGTRHPSQDNMAVAVLVEEIERRRAESPEAAYELVVRAGRNFGVIGQLLRQAALLKTATPEGTAYVVEVLAGKNGKKLSPAERQAILEAAKADRQARTDMQQAERVFQQNPSRPNEEVLNRATARAETESARLQRASTAVLPRTWADMIRYQMQGNALTPVSQAANILGNVVMQPIRGVAQTIAATAEGVLSVLSGGRIQRTIGQPMVDLGAYGQGAAVGLSKAPGIVKTGVNPLTTTAGEIHRGFQPMQAWVRQLGSIRSGEKLGLNERAKLAVEGTFGVPAEAMFRLLAVGDAPFYQGAYNQALHEIGRLQGLEGRQLEAWMRAPPDRARQLAKSRAEEAVFQGDTILSKAFMGLASFGKGKGQGADMANALLIRPVMLFAKTPANIAYEASRFLNPVHSLAGMLVHGAKREQREAMMSFGRMITGMTMWAAASLLAKSGLISSGEKKDEKERNLRFATGLKPRSLNITGLGRLLNGEDPAFQDGDKQIDYRNLGLIGLAFGMQMDGLDDMQRKARDAGQQFSPKDADWWSVVPAGLQNLPTGLMDLTMMRGTYDALKAITQNRYDRWFASYFNTVAGAALPNSLAALSRSMQDYIPDYQVKPEQSDAIATMEAGARTAVNMQAAKLWAMSEAARRLTGLQARQMNIPLKRDLYGRPIVQTPDGRSAAAFNLVDVLKLQDITRDQYAGEIDTIYQATGDRDVIPGEPKDVIQWVSNGPKVRLSAVQHERYQELVGSIRLNAMASLMKLPGWPELDPIYKASVVKRINSEATTYGKAQLSYEIQNGLK